MTSFGELNNFSLGGDSQLTCSHMPFLPGCHAVVEAQQYGGRNPSTSCVVGTVTGTYANGDPFMAEVIERTRTGHPERVFRDFKLPSGMVFQMRNPGRTDDTYDAFQNGDTVALDMIESGLTGTVNIHTDDANICKSRAYSGYEVVAPYYAARREGGSRYSHGGLTGSAGPIVQHNYNPTIHNHNHAVFTHSHGDYGEHSHANTCPFYS